MIFIVKTISNMKALVIKTKHYQSKNTIIKLNHTRKMLQIISKNFIQGKFN